MYYEVEAGKIKFITNQKFIYHRYDGIRCFNIVQSAMSLRFVITAYISFCGIQIYSHYYLLE